MKHFVLEKKLVFREGAVLQPQVTLTFDSVFQSDAVIGPALNPGDEVYTLEGNALVMYHIPRDPAPVPAQVKARLIDELGLTTWTTHRLKADNILYWGELLERSEYELLRTPNLGRKGLDEIKEALAMYGLSLKAP